LLATHTGTGAEIAGIATVTWTTSAAHGRLAEVAELYVRPDARRRGVATALLEAAIAWARDHGCTVCRLSVGPDGELSHGVAGFFAARGFDDDYRKVLVREVRGVSRSAQASPGEAAS
ncbi:MAG TPA: GNAT family N-acetyltransferase, partial [Thermoleophilia bacterium]|nr:GNAT family N-acetyltransferase [Thermoleophilia bacterium]